jgi:hypothetical protein
MITVSPAGISTAPVANKLPLSVTITEKLIRPFCINASNQPQYTVSYSYDNPQMNGTAVFIPIKVNVKISSPSCGNRSVDQLYTETFMAVFEGQTAIPTSVTITENGSIGYGSSVLCYRAKSYSISESIDVTIA